MRIDEFEFRNKKGQEIEPTKAMLVCYIKSLHKNIKYLQKQLAEKEKELENYKLCRCVNCTNEYEYMLEKTIEELEKEIEHHNQDKIELMEKVLNKLISIYECIYSQHYDFALIEIEKFIKEIKGENK